VNNKKVIEAYRKVLKVSILELWSDEAWSNKKENIEPSAIPPFLQHSEVH
jgi:hypothetical protein